MSWFSTKKENNNPIEWQEIQSIAELNEMISLSNEKTIAIFKHSTRCSISTMAKSRFERSWNYDNETVLPVYLDLIAHRDVSNAIEDQLGVIHASPQLIVLKEEKVIHNSSHNSINAETIEKLV